MYLTTLRIVKGDRQLKSSFIACSLTLGSSERPGRLRYRISSSSSPHVCVKDGNCSWRVTAYILIGSGTSNKSLARYSSNRLNILGLVHTFLRNILILFSSLDAGYPLVTKQKPFLTKNLPRKISLILYFDDRAAGTSGDRLVYISLRSSRNRCVVT